MEEQKNNNEEVVKANNENVSVDGSQTNETVSENKETKTESESVAEATGSDNTMTMAIIGYIFPLLFFIPLLTEAKNDKFARFHANQQLLLLIGSVIVTMLSHMFFGWMIYSFAFSAIGGILINLGSIFWLVFAIIGVINVSKKKMERLPIFGNIDIIK